MPGPDRQEKHKATSDARRKAFPYSRSVRFSDATSVIPCPMTPTKQLARGSESSIESLKLRRKQNVSAAQRYYDGLSARAARVGSITDVLKHDDGSSVGDEAKEWRSRRSRRASTPFAPSDPRRTRSLSLLTSNVDMFPLPGSTNNHPESSQRKQPSIPELQEEILQLKAKLADQQAEHSRQVDRLKLEKSRMGDTIQHQTEKYQYTVSLMQRTCTREYWSVLGEYLDTKEKGLGPERKIDDDYDEGYDPRVARLATTRADFSKKYGFKESMDLEETIDQMADAMAVHWNLKDDEEMAILASPQTNITFPPLVVPSIPQFEF